MTTATVTERKLGGLYVNGEEFAFPLKHTDVEAKIAGNLSRVEVRQTFENPFTKTLEAVYIFPLPDEAAVDEMEIKIGDRIIKGNIKKREEAQEIYQQAQQEGRTAGLLEQERDNIFTQSLANILPGEQIDVTIRYSDSLKFEGGNYEFVFPMVVGPRYIPGTPIESSAGSGTASAPMTRNQDTDIVPDASHLNAPILPEGMRSRQDINVTVEIDAGVPIQKITSPSHKLQIEYLDAASSNVSRDGEDPPQPPLSRGEKEASSGFPDKKTAKHLLSSRQKNSEASSDIPTRKQRSIDRLPPNEEIAKRPLTPRQKNSEASIVLPLDKGDKRGIHIQLGGGDTIPNKDFILRYQVAGDNTQATVLTQADKRGGHFAVYLIPAIEYNRDEIIPKDVVFLVDTSGSQHGDPLMKCQELMRRFINGLNPHDTFSILDFSNRVRQLSPKPLPNTDENRQKALNYISNLNACGGTEMLSGIRAAINFPAPEGRVRTVVLLTDGYIGNEKQILAEVQQNLQRGNRLYSFGAGSSVNRFLLNRVAEVGRGLSYIIRHDEPTEEITEKFFRQINNPVLTDLEVAWDGEGEFPTLYPAKASDLFAEQPLVLFGRKQDGIPGKLCISGTSVGGKPYEQTFDLKFDPKAGNPAVAQLWGRQRIKALTNEMFAYETKAGVEAVTETALTYQLLSKYTAFVAVSEEVRVNPEGETVSVQVPVEMPEGVSHTGIFGTEMVEEQGRGISMPAAGAAPTQVLYGAIARGSSPVMRSKRRFCESAQAEDFAQPPSSPESTVYRAMAVDTSYTDVEDDLGTAAPHSAYIDDDFEELGDLIAEVEEDLESLQPIAVISATGLDEDAATSLNQHLHNLDLPSGFSGTLVFELMVNAKGRVMRVLLDEDASMLKDVKLVEAIKRSLFRWKVPTSVRGTVTVTLQVRS